MKYKSMHLRLKLDFHNKLKRLSEKRNIPMTQILIQSTLNQYPELLEENEISRETLHTKES